MSRILVHLSRPDAALACLAAAAQAARELPEPQIDVLYVQADPIASILPTEEVLTKEREAALRRQAAASRAALHAAWLAWRDTAPPSQWQEASGRPGEQVVQRCAAAALVGWLCRAAWAASRPRHLRCGAVRRRMRRAGSAGRLERPVRPALCRRLARHVRRAPSGCGRRALARCRAGDHRDRDRRASGCAAAAAAGRLVGKFARQTVPAADRCEGVALLAAAARSGAVGLVLGAYRRGRLLEWALGGVTEHVLRHASLPLLLKH